MSRALTGERLRRIMPEDTPEELARTLADEDAPDVEPVEPDRRALLAQMYPSDQPLPAGGGANDAMVSLPGGQLGGEIRAAPAQPEPASPARQPAVTKVPEEKPGGGGYSFDLARGLTGFAGGPGAIAAYDKAEQERKEAPLKMEMQRGELADKQSERATKLKDIRDAMDPGSESSRAAQESFAAINEARAKVLADKNPALAKVFAQAAAGAKGKTRLQLNNAEAHHKQVMGEILKVIDADARRALAERGLDLREDGTRAQQSNAAESRAMRRDALSETNRHNQAMEANGAQKIDAKIQGNQDKLNEKIEGLNNAEGLLDQASEAKKNVDVGPIATRINKLRQYTPWPDKDFDQLQQTLGSVRNEIKLLKAGKAVTASEEKGLNEELANLEQMQNDPTFEAKLNGMKQRLSGYKQQAVNQYQRKAGGQTVDRSNTARVSTQAQPSLTPGEQAGSAPPPAPAPGTPAGAKVRNKRTGETWTWDGAQWGR